jgi:putative transposase
MARPLRVEFENAIYHLCARGNARQAIFHDQHDCARFVRLLCESAQRFEAAVLCFVLMGNHFHLVAQSHRPNLQRWMHSLCGGFGRRELNRCARLGNFWRAGYAAVAQRIRRIRLAYDTRIQRKLLKEMLNVET